MKCFGKRRPVKFAPPEAKTSQSENRIVVSGWIPRSVCRFGRELVVCRDLYLSELGRQKQSSRQATNQMGQIHHLAEVRVAAPNPVFRPDFRVAKRKYQIRGRSSASPPRVEVNRRVRAENVIRPRDLDERIAAAGTFRR